MSPPHDGDSVHDKIKIEIKREIIQNVMYFTKYFLTNERIRKLCDLSHKIAFFSLRML